MPLYYICTDLTSNPELGSQPIWLTWRKSDGLLMSSLVILLGLFLLPFLSFLLLLDGDTTGAGANNVRIIFIGFEMKNHDTMKPNPAYKTLIKGKNENKNYLYCFGYFCGIVKLTFATWRWKMGFYTLTSIVQFRYIYNLSSCCHFLGNYLQRHSRKLLWH